MHRLRRSTIADSCDRKQLHYFHGPTERKWVICTVAAALLVYLAGLFLLTHLPEQLLPSLPWDDVILHALGYAGLAALLSVAVTPVGPFQSGVAGHIYRAALTLSLVVLVALVDELTQPITGRTFQWRDLAADMLGGMSVLILLTGSVLARDMATSTDSSMP